MKITQDKIDYIKENPNLSCVELSKILKIDRHTVSKYKKEFNISTTKNYDKYKQYILDNYYSKTSIQLSEEIGCSRSYITKVWCENNLSGKSHYSYYCNYNYFSKIDNSEKAYLIGLLSADGCLYQRPEHQGLIQLSLNSKDEQILQDILQVLDSTHPINKSGSMSSISITSNVMFKDLNKIGLFPQKTWTINLKEILNNIPFDLHKDFFRGYFDGDGSITSSDNFKTISRTKIEIVGPEQSMKDMQKSLEEHQIKANIREDNREYTNSFYTLYFNNIKQKYLFSKWIYQNPTLKLNRKYNLIKQFIQRVEDNETNRIENVIAVKNYQELRNGVNGK